MSFTCYSEYTHSAIAWIPKIPAHWKVLQARHLFKHRQEGATQEDEQLSATQQYGVIPQRLFMVQQDQKVVLALNGLSNFKHVEPNDFVISLRSFQGGIERSLYAGCVSPAYTVLHPTDHLVGKYWEYLLKCSSFIAALQATTEGIRDGKTISYSQFSTLWLPLAPPSEQTAIASFLDRETAKIDCLIAEQEKLIALLAEKRQATISQAVTRGLNPDAPMKDYGAAWLGEVPAHWGITRLKFVASVQTGIAKGKDIGGKVTVSVPYLRVANVQDGFLALDNVTSIDIEPAQLDRYRLRPGDVLMNEGGDFDKLGRGAIWSGEIQDCIHQNHVFAVRPHAISSQWLNQITSSSYARFYFMCRSKQSTNLASISSSNIMELPVPTPPHDEQAEISQFIAREMERISALEAEAKRSVVLLNERRSALIAAAVTGQIDVRNSTAQIGVEEKTEAI